MRNSLFVGLVAWVGPIMIMLGHGIFVLCPSGTIEILRPEVSTSTAVLVLLLILLASTINKQIDC
jgi:hypothetical protein